MASLSLTVKPYKRADGTYQVAVALSHHSVTCYIATGIYVTDPQHLVGSLLRCERDHINKSMRLGATLERYRDVLLELGDIKRYTCVQLKDIMLSHCAEKRITLCGVAEERKAQCRPATATVIAGAIKRWLMYSCDVEVAHLTPNLIRDFCAFLQNNTRYSVDTVSITLRTIKSLVNYAIKNQYVSYKVHPFVNTVAPRGRVRELPLTLDDIKTIRDYAPVGKQEALAKDFFFLTLFLGGMNVGDIVNLDYRKGDETVRYVRRKTSGTTLTTQEVVLPVIQEAREILDKYTDERGVWRLGYRFTAANLAHYISANVRKLMDKIGMNKRIVLYSARKGFAQFALDLGYSDNIINYCLGHSNSSRGIISYYNKVRVEQARQCLEAVAKYIQKSTSGIEAL